MRDAQLKTLTAAIHACEKCPRLREYCIEIARIKRKSYAEDSYWGKPISGFGAPDARLMVIGLAPAAHGANRTGRIFTGDRSGEWLYRALFRAGFANQAESVHREDGLLLIDAYVTCIGRCAPPDNKPLPAEIEQCVPYLERELEIFANVQVYVTLGQIALNGLWQVLSKQSVVTGLKKPKFTHGGRLELPNGKLLLMSYHPSQQNTFTGRLTEPMFDAVFSAAKNVLSSSRRT